MKHKYIIAAVAALASLVACDKFLDTMPDNRTEIDSPEKVKALLGAAYSDHIYSMVTELLSDNMDNNRAVVMGEVTHRNAQYLAVILHITNSWPWR